jgi:lysophospholipase L1-like esterase
MLLARCADPATRVFVQSTLFTSRDFKPSINERVTELNSKLQDLCSDTLQLCKFIDLNKIMSPDGSLTMTPDGLHLSPEGYQAWRDEIAPYVRHN